MDQREQDIKFLKRAVQLSAIGVKQKKGGPFGCVIVLNGEIVGEGYNKVTSQFDPTAHGQMTAIRNACKNLKVIHLSGCTVYSSCEPCPMCTGAIHWCNASRVVYANTQKDASTINDQIDYEQVAHSYDSRKIKFENIPLPEALEVFKEWKNHQSKQNL